MSYQHICYSVKDGIATIRLNSPQTLNALNGELNRDIADALKEVKADKSVRALIVTGDAKAFAAGADVKEMASASPRFAREISELARDINNTLETLPIPTIAAVAGFAFGGGCEMSLACDFRIGGPRTRLSFPEVSLGLATGAGGSARAVALVGVAKAKELILLTPVVGGEEAYRIGLLSRYVDSLDCEELNRAASEAKKAVKEARELGDEAAAEAKKRFNEIENTAAQREYEEINAKALEMARALAEKPACSIAAAKIALNRAATETVSAGKEAESADFALLFGTHDQREGMAALLEKRAPIFTHN
jgi:enoyl-CoA hydratase